MPLGNNVNSISQQFIKNAKLTKFEIYNLKQDIGEQHNLAWQQPNRLKELKQKLVEKYAAVQKEGPVWDTSDYEQEREKRLFPQKTKQ